MNSKKEIAAMQEVEILKSRLGYGAKMLRAVHEAIVCGESPAEEYTDAVFGVYDYISSINEELGELLDSYFGVSARKSSDDGN